MKTTYLRASTINTYKDCEFRYYLHYVVGFPSISGKKADLGSCVHHVLELLAKANKLGYKKYGESFRTDPKILLDICFNRYKSDDWDEKDYKFCQEQIESVIHSHYDPLKLNVLRTEHQFEIEVNKSGFEIDDQYMSIRGTIDLVTEKDHETLEVIDYKTGQRTDWITGDEKTWEKFLADTQLRMYHLATSALYKDYKYKLFTIIFTRDGGPFTVTFEEHELQETLENFRRVFREINANDMPSRILDDKEKINQIWKCEYVCQFGLMEMTYMTEEGKLLDFSNKRIWNKYRKKRTYPLEIEHEGEIYHRIEVEPTRICDKLYDKVKVMGSADKAEETLYQIALDEQLKQKVSKRNDYTNSKISKLRLF